MKYLKLSSLFFLASLFQVMIVVLGERTGFSQFAIQFSFFKVVHHFLVGQILGFVIYYLVKKVFDIKKQTTIIMFGSGYGIFAWAALMIVGLHSGLIQSTWLQFGGIVTTMIAFVGYGVICGLASYEQTR